MHPSSYYGVTSELHGTFWSFVAVWGYFYRTTVYTSLRFSVSCFSIEPVSLRDSFRAKRPWLLFWLVLDLHTRRLHLLFSFRALARPSHIFKRWSLTVDVVAAAAAGSSIQIYVEDLTKICRQELPRSIPEELAHKHQCKASSRS